MKNSHTGMRCGFDNFCFKQPPNITKEEQNSNRYEVDLTKNVTKFTICFPVMLAKRNEEMKGSSEAATGSQLATVLKLITRERLLLLLLCGFWDCFFPLRKMIFFEGN
jgi:hypothetical protein